MADFNINNLLNRGATSSGTSTNFDALLNLARGQLEEISRNVQNLINQLNLNTRVVTQDQTGGFRVQVPQLSNLIAGQQDVLLKTAFPLDKTQNFNLQVQNSNVVLSQGQPVLRLEGQIVQEQIQQNNPATQRFTAEIPLSSLSSRTAQNNPATGTGGQIPAGNNQANDQVVRNFLPSNQLNAFTNNLSETLRPLLPQNLQNVNLISQNIFNIQITTITTPGGQQIIIDPNAIQNPQQIPTQVPPQNIPQGQNIQPQNISQILPQNPNQPQIISGQVEIFPEANEALIRTDFGTFRVSGLTNIPNGSTISFAVQGQAIQRVENPNELLNLNPTNLQTLRLVLESPASPIQSLLKVLNSSQSFAPVVQQLFPHPDDKASYMRQLMFLSAAAKGSPEGWLGDKGQMVINQLHESDTNLGRLQEVFGAMKNFTGHTEKPLNLDWNSYIIPFYDGSKLSFVTVQVQRDPEGNQQHTTKGKRKFILELEQDDLGRVAIEGLYSKFEGKVNNLDIILKTENEVDEEFQKELAGIFNDTATAYNFTGVLSFGSFTTSTPLYTDISKILGDGIVI